jgi:hypothetical protein
LFRAINEWDLERKTKKRRWGWVADQGQLGEKMESGRREDQGPG